MKRLRRILVTVFLTLLVVFAAVRWVAPVALSFYAAKKAPPIARIVPAELKDTSVSPVPTTKLSYFGYEFEVPWTDLDDNQTKFYPKDKPDKFLVNLHFHSGLQVRISAAPAGVWSKQLSTQFNTSPQTLESVFGRGVMKSDYSFAKALWEFSPEKMNHWVTSQGPMNKDEFLLIIKSIALPKAAETGIFNIHNQNYRGFQFGNPQVRQDGIIVDLYSDDGGVEVGFFQKDYKNATGVTQAEINRIIQSLHKSSSNDSPTRIARN